MAHMLCPVHDLQSVHLMPTWSRCHFVFSVSPSHANMVVLSFCVQCVSLTHQFSLSLSCLSVQLSPLILLSLCKHVSVEFGPSSLGVILCLHSVRLAHLVSPSFCVQWSNPASSPSHVAVVLCSVSVQLIPSDLIEFCVQYCISPP